MKKHIERTWTKQDAKDASRLLAELAKRAEKASGGFKRPERIQSEETVPASSEKCRESERKRGEALHDSRQSTAYPAGGVTGGGFLIAMNDNFDGQILLFGAVSTKSDADCPPPHTDDSTGCTDRAYVTLCVGE